MRIRIVQHSAADRPAAAADVIDRLGHFAETTRIDRGDALPTTVDADVLMMFGGGISLASGELPPWVAQEQKLIRSYVNEGRRVIGICLGSQMIAAALGARVRRNDHCEVGWHEIERAEDSVSPNIADEIPNRLIVLQWHQDTFDLPPGATRLFRSAACDNQAFEIDNRVFGFQFHFEANPKTVTTFLAVSNKWKQHGQFVQSESEISSGIETHLPAQTESLNRFLDAYLVD